MHCAGILLVANTASELMQSQNDNVSNKLCMHYFTVFNMTCDVALILLSQFFPSVIIYWLTYIFVN